MVRRHSYSLRDDCTTALIQCLVHCTAANRLSNDTKQICMRYIYIKSLYKPCKADFAERSPFRSIPKEASSLTTSHLPLETVAPSTQGINGYCR